MHSTHTTTTHPRSTKYVLNSDPIHPSIEQTTYSPPAHPRPVQQLVIVITALTTTATVVSTTLSDTYKCDNNNGWLCGVPRTSFRQNVPDKSQQIIQLSPLSAHSPSSHFPFAFPSLPPCGRKGGCLWPETGHVVGQQTRPTLLRSIDILLLYCRLKRHLPLASSHTVPSARHERGQCPGGRFHCSGRPSTERIPSGRRAA